MAADLLLLVRGWQRKASSWDTPYAPTPSLEAQEAIEALPVFHVATRFPCTSLGFEAPQYFVAVRPDARRFLVATEGYDYARYIVQLPQI